MKWHLTLRDFATILIVIGQIICVVWLFISIIHNSQVPPKWPTETGEMMRYRKEKQKQADLEMNSSIIGFVAGFVLIVAVNWKGR